MSGEGEASGITCVFHPHIVSSRGMTLFCLEEEQRSGTDQ